MPHCLGKKSKLPKVELSEGRKPSRNSQKRTRGLVSQINDKINGNEIEEFSGTEME